MYLRVIWLFVNLCLMVAKCCVISNEKHLQQMWMNLSTSDCGYQAMLMLPGLSELSHHKGESIERFPCTGSGENCPEDDPLCAKCNKIKKDRITKEVCPQAMPTPGHQPIEVSSGCSWHYKTTNNKYRYPKKITEAFCNCNHCAFQEGSEFHCEGVYHKIPVLLANNIDGPAECNYDLKYQDLRVGCTCARKPSLAKVLSPITEHDHNLNHNNPQKQPHSKPIVQIKENEGVPVEDDRKPKHEKKPSKPKRQGSTLSKKCKKAFKKCQKAKGKGSNLCKTKRKTCLNRPSFR